MNLVPLRLVISPLPPGFVGGPQDIIDAIEAGAQIVTDSAYSLFVVGPTAPTSDEGPWWQNGITPWVWDVITGAYIPVVLNPISLRYGIFATASLPADNTDYDVVIEVDAGGVPLAVKIWYSGAWTDVYANSLAGYVTAATLAATCYTKAETDAAIIAAFSSYEIFQFRVSKSVGPQVYTTGSGIFQVSFNNMEYDPEGAWDAGSNSYIAPMAGYYEFSAAVVFTLDTGSSTNVTHTLYLRNNAATIQWMIQNNATSLNVGLQASTQIHLAAGDHVDVAVDVAGTGASTWNIPASPNQVNFFGKLIRAD